MESVALHGRASLAPSASALATESARPLADGLIKSPKPLMKKQAVKRHHHKHNLRHRYEFLETLGKGTYGKVKKARESSGRLVAIKSIRKDKIKDEQDLLHIRREIEIMSSLNHPHIIAIHEGTIVGRLELGARNLGTGVHRSQICQHEEVTCAQW